LMDTRCRPLFLIDISVPRNIESAVQRLDNVYLYNIDDLVAIVRENVRSREQELALCHQIIAARARALMGKLNFETARFRDEGRLTETGWTCPGAVVLAG